MERRHAHTSILKSCTHRLESLLLGAWRRSPGQPHKAETNRPYFLADELRHPRIMLRKNREKFEK